MAQIKSTVGLWGSVLGDVMIKVQDDAQREQVYFELVHPAKIQQLTLDSRNNIKGYILAERRLDPERPNSGVYVTYTEQATRSGENVRYQTTKNGEPYDWGNGAADWMVPYGFVPMIQIKHIDAGLDWGWSELHGGMSKFREIDDLASKLHDHIRKSVDPAWFFSGVAKPKKEDGAVRRTETDPTPDKPEPGRSELPIFYANNPNAKAKDLVSNLSVEAVGMQVANLIDELERDYPEIREDEKLALQSNSSRAIRVARQPTEVKAHETRVNYDDGLVRAHKMAMTIGGLRGYKGFDKFGEQAFADGTEDHSIGKRSVFAKDPIDDLEYQTDFWKMAAMAVPVVGLRFVLEKAQWDQDDIEKAVAEWEKNGRPSPVALGPGQTPPPPTAGGGQPQPQPAAPAPTNGKQPAPSA
jgi:hypothetical protein